MELEQGLSHTGRYLTRTRRLALEAISRLGASFSAEQLAAETGEMVSRATIYRTLRLLVDQGLVCKISLQDGAPRYSLSPVNHHHHLICVGCGAVSEFDRSAIERALAELRGEVSGTIVGHRLEVYFFCQACQRKGSAARREVHSEGFLPTEPCIAV